MIIEQTITTIEKADLPKHVEAMKAEGRRLVHICCTLAETFELTYSFDKNYDLKQFRIQLSRDDATIQSITGMYLCAFTYENELHDLYGINVVGNAIDFKGNFYQTKTKTPFYFDNPQGATK